MKFKIFKFKSVTSTNDTAMSLIKEKKEIGCVYADNQTKGRGTYGKKWISNKGNLFGTVFFPLESKYPSFSEFSIINPVIISSVVRRFCRKKKVSLKWPNDVFVDGKKICGILQELITFNSKTFLVIGIGLNVESNPNIYSKYKTTNIFLETRKKPSIKEIINLIVCSYENFFLDLESYNYKSFKKKAESLALN